MVRAATDGRGADVVLDNMGAKYLARNLEVLAPNGRLAVIGMQGGTKAELDIGLLMRKRGAVLSTGLRARPAEEKAAIVASTASTSGRCWSPARSGRWSTGCCRWPQAAEAHRLMEASDHVGKVLLTT